MTANNTKIYSQPYNLVDFTITDPYTNISFNQHRVEYIKPKVYFAMTRNSSGYAEEMDFEYQIQKLNKSGTRPLKESDIMFFDCTFMSFDEDTQTILFK